MRRNKKTIEIVEVEEPQEAFSIQLTHRQMQFINYLKSHGGKARRRQLFWDFGPSVDNVASALIQKGLIARISEGASISYKLTKLGDV